MNSAAVHTFDNGVKVYDHHLTPEQRARYARSNVHEADEERLFLDVLDGLPDDGCFLNVGCAIGYYTLLARRRKPDLEIHAVEPLPQHIQYFWENVALNGHERSSFTLHTVGVADQEGIATLVEQKYGSWIERGAPRPGVLALVRGALHALVAGGKKKAGKAQRQRQTFRVPTLRLDQLLDRIGHAVDLLQMDVQGLELAILQSALDAIRSGCVRTILVGTHSAELHEACRSLLAGAGYAIVHEEQAPPNQPDGIILARRQAGENRAAA